MLGTLISDSEEEQVRGRISHHTSIFERNQHGITLEVSYRRNKIADNHPGEIAGKITSLSINSSKHPGLCLS